MAIALVLPAFGPLAADDAGRDRRFASDAESVRGLPRPVVPTLCAAYGTLAEDAVRARICRHDGADAAADRIDGVPAVVRRAHAQAVDAFFAPLRHAKASVDELQRQQREGEGDVQALGLAIESARARVAPYAERYGLDPVAGRGPRSLECAFERLHAGMPRTGDASPALHEITRANAVLLFGAALDGLPATAAVATAAALPATAAVSPACAETSLVESLAVAATVMAEARATPAGIAKDAAMRGLLRNAGWQWAGWGLTGLVLLNLARSGLSPAAGVAVALSTWAVAAFVGRVPAPFMHDGEIVFGRAAEPMLSEPAGFVVALLACALAILPFVRFRGSATQSVRAAAGSPLAFPGLVLATGVGFVVLLDLSAHAHFANRYLALYHHGHLWLGMLVFSTVAFLRRPLGRALAWTLSVADAAAGRLVRAFGTVAAGAALLALAMAAAGLAAALLGNMRQLTSEIGRLWLIVGAAWFFFMRGTPLAERVARGGSTIGSLVRYVAPLAFVAAVLLAAMVATRDMGPLLIAGYGAGAFVAASVAMWWHQRRNAGAAAYAIAAALFVGWIVVTTSALLRFGELDPVTSGRIENAAAPLASANDQLALVTWFQRAAPADGFGPGGVPWCGHASTARCAGVPAQVQSDYTFTALVGVFGPSAAWAFTLACVGWLHAVVRAHARATRGEPRIVRRARGFGIDEQAFVSWLCVAWVVLAMCQLAVTVAGNLAVIPLTGVTFPFVSFGMTSLVVNMAMLGLAANVDASHGNA